MAADYLRRAGAGFLGGSLAGSSNQPAAGHFAQSPPADEGIAAKLEARLSKREILIVEQRRMALSCGMAGRARMVTAPSRTSSLAILL